MTIVEPPMLDAARTSTDVRRARTGAAPGRLWRVRRSRRHEVLVGFSLGAVVRADWTRRLVPLPHRHASSDWRCAVPDSQAATPRPCSPAARWSARLPSICSSWTPVSVAPSFRSRCSSSSSSSRSGARSSLRPACRALQLRFRRPRLQNGRWACETADGINRKPQHNRDFGRGLVACALRPGVRCPTVPGSLYCARPRSNPGLSRSG